MKFLLLTAALATLSYGRLHNLAVCVKNRSITNPGGTPFSPSMTYYKDYEIMTEATNCACGYYKNRNTGDKQWDKCPDCTFDGSFCNSAGWHIGGDEMNHYCTKYCGAEGSEAN